MKARTSLSGVLLAMCALAIIAIGWGEFLAPSVQGGYPIRLSDRSDGPYISGVTGKAPQNAGLAVGDAVDLSRLSFGDRELSARLNATEQRLESALRLERAR